MFDARCGISPTEKFWLERKGWTYCASVVHMPATPNPKSKTERTSSTFYLQAKENKVNEESGSQMTQEVNIELSESQEEIIEKEPMTLADILPKPDGEDDVSDND